VGVTYIRSGYSMGLKRWWVVAEVCGGRAEVTAEYIVRIALQNYSEAGCKGESGELSKHAVTAARRLSVLRGRRRVAASLLALHRQRGTSQGVEAVV
jgi:hypothetical protein